MKKSITTLAVVLLASFQALAAHSENHNKIVADSNDPTIAPDLSGLTRSVRTIDEIIAADLKVTEAVFPATIKMPVKHKPKVRKARVQISKPLSN